MDLSEHLQSSYAHVFQGEFGDVGPPGPTIVVDTEGALISGAYI